MLSFDLRALEAQAAAVDGVLEPSDPIWDADDPRPLEPLRVTGRLSSAGAGHVYFRGRLESVAGGECRRCLTDVTTPVALDSHLVFVASDEEGADEESDAYVFDATAGELDLRPALREEWLLHAPAFPLCREDCRGLCASCGADRNLAADAGGCDCQPAADPRWAALRGAVSS